MRRILMFMPNMGDAMEEGTLLKWLKSEGEEVSEGDPIAQIETDGDTTELEAEDEGILAQLIASEGQQVPVGEAIAVIQGQDTTDQAVGQGQDAPGQVTDQAGQAVGQAHDTVGGVIDQVQGVAGQATDQAGQVADQAQEAVGQAADQAQYVASQMAESLPGGYEPLGQPFPDEQGNTLLRGQDEQGNTVIVRRRTDDQGNTIDSIVPIVAGMLNVQRPQDNEAGRAQEERAGSMRVEGVAPRRSQSTSSSTRRLNVVFSEAAYDELKDLADKSGKTISDVVRDAIALQKWFNDVRRNGRILVEERGRGVREIINIR